MFAGRGMSAAEMLNLARQAQQAQLEGRQGDAQAISYRIRGAPGEVFADIEATRQVKVALDAGDVEGAKKAASIMTGQSLANPQAAARAGMSTVQAAIAKVEESLADAADAAASRRWWLWLALGGGATGLFLWWGLRR